MITDAILAYFGTIFGFAQNLIVGLLPLPPIWWDVNWIVNVVELGLYGSYFLPLTFIGVSLAWRVVGLNVVRAGIGTVRNAVSLFTGGGGK